MTVTCSGRRVPALIAQALISQLQLVIRHLTGANTMRALMRAILPLQIPARRGRLGEGRTWLLFELFHVAVLLLVTTTTSPTVAVAGVAAFGAPFAAFLVIPYSIVGRAAAQSDSCGAYMATMNLFLCLPGERWIIIMSILLFTCMFMMNLFLCLPGERRGAPSDSRHAPVARLPIGVEMTISRVEMTISCPCLLTAPTYHQPRTPFHLPPSTVLPIVHAVHLTPIALTYLIRVAHAAELLVSPVTFRYIPLQSSSSLSCSARSSPPPAARCGRHSPSPRQSPSSGRPS